MGPGRGDHTALRGGRCPGPGHGVSSADLCGVACGAARRCRRGGPRSGERACSEEEEEEEVGPLSSSTCGDASSVSSARGRVRGEDRVRAPSLSPRRTDAPGPGFLPRDLASAGGARWVPARGDRAAAGD